MWFDVIVLSLIFLTLLWRRRMEVRLGAFAHPRLYSVLLTLFAGAMVCLPLLAVMRGHFLPAWLTAPGFLWHIMVVPLAAIELVVVEWTMPVRKETFAQDFAPTDISRRRFLTAAAIAGPVALTAGLDVAAGIQLGTFRVRQVDLTIAGWPANLDGFAMALVADVHTGPFTTPRMLEEIVRRTNTIHNGGPADLVVLGGDLINTTLDDLPAGLEMARALRGRLGTVACLGNHDVMDDQYRFVAEIEKAGIPLLRDNSLRLEPAPGVKVQILGVDWRRGDYALNQSVAAAAKLREPGWFPICVAHHPHAWDEAVRQGLPLVLSGHTHGGQIMLTENIGGGPLRFRYWSGIHRRDNSTLVISNGVGNWFPLRYNAPAEILKIVLHPADVRSLTASEEEMPTRPESLA
jgi:uncharacterized protein